ncbi:MAG: nickel pincer cofactor biosynthesis protein LarC [Magnetococcales bacterium]|nr:nickel pincer cofactor biosynthesis protein LarC [Magnetococcales bacterium]
MRIHLDPVSGIAGDMFVAACLDLGLNRDELTQALGTLKLPPWQLEVTQQRRMGLVGTHVAFKVPHEHHHRHLPDILNIIQQSALPPAVQHNASRVFTLLAEAEGKVHGIDANAVHFHEVGAMDAILDVCAAAFAVWRLNISTLSASPPPVGSGTVRCAHGIMPVPVPAVAEMFRQHRLPLQPGQEEPSGELVTPTGAAILIHFCKRFGACHLPRIDAIGLGLGTRDIPNRCNGLRILAHKEDPSGDPVQLDRIAILSTHIDDMNPEWYGLLWDQLFQAGALDVAISPVTMKKGRPGVRLEIISPETIAPSLARLVLNHTTTLGVRIQPCDRITLPRNSQTRSTPWGELRIKRAGHHVKPEYDDLVAMATTMNWSLPETQARIAPYLDIANDNTP